MIRTLPTLAVLVVLAAFRLSSAQEHVHSPTPAPASIAPAGTPPGPPVLVNASPRPGTVEVTLTAAPERLSLQPGATSLAYAYNGRVPGPTLEVHEGDRVTIHFRNRLPEATTVHWHGLHIPVTSDGSPFIPIPPGGAHDYVFTLQRGSAGTYWYHPHPHGRTGRQIGMGLLGALIVRAADDPLPASLVEQTLVLADNRFAASGAIDFPDPASAAGRVDEVNGREGDVLFVNGQINPVIPIRGGEIQRWSILNASASRVYRLAIPGATFLQVGTDGGLFERPVEREEIVLANSERVEVLVRGTAAPGAVQVLRALPYDRYVPQTRPAQWNVARDLLSLQYSDEAPMAPLPLPDRLRVVPPLDPARATATRVIAFSQNLINGRAMDLTRIDERAKLGATEIWTIENLVGMDHPFHLHGFQFQILDRNGVPEPFRAWKDSVNVPKHESVRLIVQFMDYPGKWMFHCHILDHEDLGMMGILSVN